MFHYNYCLNLQLYKYSSQNTYLKVNILYDAPKVITNKFKLNINMFYTISQSNQ